MTVPARAQPRHEPAGDPRTAFLQDVRAGLSVTPKRLPCKYFYDAAGSQLFEQITELPEYYPTRTERRILNDNAAAIARFVLPNAALVEFGSGSSAKARILMQSATFTSYVPVDISAEFLTDEVARLQRDVPRLDVLPVTADFTQAFELPLAVRSRPRMGFFPGSTIGNFEPEGAAGFLRHAARILGSGAMLIIGADLVKSPSILHAAYNDAAGVTAAFNLNLLARINRELGGDFDLAAFEHYAFYNCGRSRIEMHLASRRRQQVSIAGTVFEFAAGETIHTENSYKYSIAGFEALARAGGWTPYAVWTDPDELFAVHALAVDEGVNAGER
jgi:L-histidine Nalpha-methyltransferase